MSVLNTKHALGAPEANAPAEGSDPAILRDVLVLEVPRLLTRRRGIGHGASSQHGQAVDDRSTERVAGESIEPKSELATYEAGWEAGQRDGAVLGREEGYRAGFESGREEGYQQGLKEGRADGLQEAYAMATQATEERLRQFDQLLSSLPGEMLKRLHQSEDEMAALCFEVICRIVGAAVTDPQSAQEVVRNAVQQVSARLIAIHVHPATLDYLKGDVDLNAWLARQSFQQGASVEWVADETVELGGCLLRSPLGSLDARLETQLAAVRDVISRGALRSSEVLP